ncbi:MAG: hypothetical protein ACI4XG_11580 [Bradyrhizobium sp.]
MAAPTVAATLHGVVFDIFGNAPEQLVLWEKLIADAGIEKQ